MQAHCRQLGLAELQDVAGIQSVEAELATQTVLVFGTASTERLLEALSTSGRKTRLIGQGSAAGVLGAPPSTCFRLDNSDLCYCVQDSTRRLLGRSAWTCARCGSRLLRWRSSRERRGTTATSLASSVLFRCVVLGSSACMSSRRAWQVNGVSTRVEGALEGLAPGRHALAVHSYGAFCVPERGDGRLMCAAMSRRRLDRRRLQHRPCAVPRRRSCSRIHLRR